MNTKMFEKIKERALNMRILVTGSKGQLGSDLVKNLTENGFVNEGVDKRNFDIVNREDTFKYIEDYNPDIIVHCAAYTDVEGSEINKTLCHNINFMGTKNIVDACKKFSILLVFISTDYVFDGEKDGAYEVDDFPNALSIYGESKVAGERYIIEMLTKYFIVRTSWLFGKQGVNFVKKMLEVAQTKKEVFVISDQFGSPTYSEDLSKKIIELMFTNKYGIYHITNEGVCSWAEFAKEIFELSGIDITVHLINTVDYDLKAKRPKNSILSKNKLIEEGFLPLPTWKDALKRYLLEA